MFFCSAIIEAFLYKKNGEKIKGKFLGKLTQVLFEVAFSMQLPITLLYWTVIPRPPDYRNTSVHGGFMVLTFSEYYYNEI